jgi:two-component system CheB/CheR fusion protein
MDVSAPKHGMETSDPPSVNAERFIGQPRSTGSGRHFVRPDLDSLYEGMQVEAILLDRAMRVRGFTPAATAIFHIAPDDCGKPIAEIGHRLDDDALLADIRRGLEQRIALDRPVRMRNGKVVYLMRVRPCRIASGDEGVSVSFVDVTSVVAVEEQQRMLVAELNHRVRNMLQVVIGLANQTVHRSENLRQFSAAFFGRMQALGRAYELLSRDGWHQVPIGELVRTQLAPFAPEDRYSVRGQPCVLTANAALSLGMVLYELATNSTKYGALSVPTGGIDIEWQLVGAEDGRQELILRWQESGGPTVRPPTRHGFGSELVARQLKYELNGRAEMRFDASGLSVTLAMPAEEALEMTAVPRGQR